MKRHFALQRWVFFYGLSLSLTVLGLSAANGQTEATARAALQKGDADTVDEAEERVVEYPDDADETADDRPLAARAEDLKRRAGEQIGDDPEGRAIVLGMHVQEADNQRVKVVEVAPASPAFDAGIKKGDEIVSFDGFKADNYRKWIDGIRKLVTDAPEGRSMPIQVERGGKRLDLRMRKAESRADDIRLATPTPLNQQIVQERQGQQPLIPFGAQNQPFRGFGGDDVLVADFFDGQFDDTLGGTTDRAIAEIFRLNVPRASRQAVDNSRGAAGNRRQSNVAQNRRLNARDLPPIEPVVADQAGQMGRIGLAGFRNELNGMLVMLDVGGLAPGTYLVSIDDPGVIAADNTGETRRPNLRPRPEDAPGIVSPQQQDQRRPQPGRRPQPLNNRPVVPNPQRRNTPPSPNQPINKPANSGGQSSGADGGRQSQSQNSGGQFTPPTVLAQVIDNSAATGTEQPVKTPATVRENQVRTPAAGQVNQSGATPLRRPRVQDTTRDPATGSNIAPTFNQIGVLTVDQSGTGRMQQVVEGVQVADVVGQAIVIHSQNTGPNTVLPQAINSPADSPIAQPGVNRQSAVEPQPGVDQPAVNPQGAVEQQQGIPAVRQSADAGQQFSGQMPVAAGIIRLISDRPAGAVDEPIIPDQQLEPGQQTAPRQSSTQEPVR